MPPRQGPNGAASAILATLPIDLPPVDLLDLIAEVALTNQWAIDASIARELAERWFKPTLVRLQSELREMRQLGRPVSIAFNSSSDYMIQGACFVEPRDSPELQDGKRRRLFSDQYYHVFAQLSPQQFETLCGKIIEYLGVENAHVTKTSGDEGIDFYGALPLGSMFFPGDLSQTVQQQLTIWVVGQAKRYLHGQPGTPEIRELVGSISLGRAGVFGGKNSPYPDLSIRVADPVFALFITTAHLSANAWRLLKRSGVIGMDGRMLAAFLADRQAGLQGEAFIEAKFLEWLDS